LLNNILLLSCSIFTCFISTRPALFWVAWNSKSSKNDIRQHNINIVILNRFCIVFFDLDKPAPPPQC
jgi:hypothetical protein